MNRRSFLAALFAAPLAALGLKQSTEPGGDYSPAEFLRDDWGLKRRHDPLLDDFYAFHRHYFRSANVYFDCGEPGGEWTSYQLVRNASGGPLAEGEAVSFYRS